jgi:hypothetical protein
MRISRKDGAARSRLEGEGAYSHPATVDAKTLVLEDLLSTLRN